MKCRLGRRKVEKSVAAVLTGFEFWHCKRCGWLCSAQEPGSLGTAHAHAEKHEGPEILGVSLPSWAGAVADPEQLDKHIEKVRIEKFEKPEYSLGEELR